MDKMREIRFRAWDKKEKKMYFLTEGKLVGIDYEVGIWAGGWELCRISAKKGKYVICGQEEGNRDDGELMQYTGLKDKNGKEIYEGDILKVEKFIFEVKYRLNKVRFMLWEVKFSRYVSIAQIFNHPKIYEIIGNIYENPELLLEKNAKNK